jgi:hypothetical protein
MSPIIGLNAVKSIRKMASICFITICFGLLVPSPFLSFAWASFPCEDVNNDGVCEAGVDNDITSALKQNGFYSTSESIVIPASMKGLLSYKGDLSLYADKLITINGRIRAGSLDISAGQQVILGPSASVYVTEGPMYLWSWDGAVALNGARIFARDSIDITALGQEVTVLPDSQLVTNNGRLSIFAGADVFVSRSRLRGEVLSVSAQGDNIDFQHNRVSAPPSGGMVSLSASGSVVNITGTSFENLDPSMLLIDAESVIQ